MSRNPQGEGPPPYDVVRASAEPSPRGDSATANLSQIHLRALSVSEASMLLSGAGRAPTGVRWHADYPMEETVSALGMLVAAHQAVGWAAERADRPEPPWWLHQIVLGTVVVGDIGFHGPPPATGPAEVEIGYNVVEELRGRGIASRACVLLLELAWRDGATVVRAEADPGNEASRRVLLRTGFRDLGGRRYRIDRPLGASA